MPTYEYRCPICLLTVVVMKSMNDETEETCDNCNVSLIKQFSSPTITFNGSGFYSTDKKS